MLACRRLARFTDRTPTYVALALCAIGYLYASPHFPAINNPNENVRVQMTAALVDEGTYRIDAIRARWGWTNDAACVDRFADGRVAACELPLPAPGAERHYYSVKAPLGSFLGVPGYAMARAIRGDALTYEEATLACRVGGAVLPALLLLLLLRRHFEEDLEGGALSRDAAFFALALGSVVLGYALMFVSHSVAALAAFASFARLSRARRSGTIAPLDAAFAGFCASATTALEYPSVFVSALLCVQALISVRPLRRSAFFALGALLPVLLVMHFQASAFGSPFSPGHLFVENPAFRGIHHRGFFGADGFHLDAAARLLVDPRLGLFTTTPFFLLAPIGAYALLADRERRVEAVMASLVFLVSYLPVTMLSNWDGGWVIGPRYLVTCLPFVAWFAAHGARTLVERGPGLSAVPLGLLAASLLCAGLPSLYYPHLPPEIRAPLADLFLPLIRAGYAPRNVGLALGLPMARSMVPMSLLAAIVLAATLRSGGRVGALRTVLLATPIAFAATAPSFAVSDLPPQVAAAQAFVLSHWAPEPPRTGP